MELVDIQTRLLETIAAIEIIESTIANCPLSKTLQIQLDSLRARKTKLEKLEAERNSMGKIDPCPICGSQCLHRSDWPIIRQDVTCLSVKDNVECVYRVPLLKDHQQVWKWKKVYQLCKKLYVDHGDHEHGCNCNDCIECENAILRIVRSREDK